MKSRILGTGLSFIKAPSLSPFPLHLQLALVYTINTAECLTITALSIRRWTRFSESSVLYFHFQLWKQTRAEQDVRVVQGSEFQTHSCQFQTPVVQCGIPGSPSVGSSRRYCLLPLSAWIYCPVGRFSFKTKKLPEPLLLGQEETFLKHPIKCLFPRTKICRLQLTLGNMEREELIWTCILNSAVTSCNVVSDSFN